MTNHKEALDAYIKKVRLIETDYVDRLEQLATRWSLHQVKGIHECGEQIKELLPFLKVYQEQYKAHVRARESARETLFGGPICKGCGCRNCMCYLNEPG